VSEQTKRDPLKTEPERFTKGFDEMFLWIYVAKDKFHVEKFNHDFGKTRSWTNAICLSTSNPLRPDYYVAATWQVEENEIDFRIDYKTTPPDEFTGHEVQSGEFMCMLGKYFKFESASCHIHARFEYPLTERQSAFPLPLKTTLNFEAEIDGISLKLPPKPQGVSRVRLTQGKTMWFVEAIGDRRANFQNFSPYTEVNAFATVIDKVLEERTT
jgi:hypothetical protein